MRARSKHAIALCACGALDMWARRRSTAALSVMKALAFTLLTLASLPYHVAAAAECTQREAISAESVTDYLDSWRNVYLFFKEFRDCYDAAIAEGAEDKIQYIWTENWSSLPEMISLVNKDPEFKKFIWQRISDETFSQERFALFVAHAIQECPSTAKEFCEAVIRESKRTSAQQGAPRGAPKAARP